MKTIKVTDAAARFIKQLREEGIEERKVFLCDTYTKAVEQVWLMMNTVRRIFTR